MQDMVITGSRQRRLLISTARPAHAPARRDPLRMPALVGFAATIGLLLALLPGMAAAPTTAGSHPAAVPAPAPIVAPVR